MPFGIPGWRWKIGRFGYTTDSEPDYEKIRAEAKTLLEKAIKGEAWRSRCGTLHIPLIVEGNIIGELWEDTEIKDLDIGTYWYGKWGIKVQLTKNGRIVGFIWLSPVTKGGDQ